MSEPSVIDSGEILMAIWDGLVLQHDLILSDDGRQRLCTRRVVVSSGHTREEFFDPPLPIDELKPPRLPDAEGTGAKGRRFRARRPDAADRRSRVARLEKRRKAAETN